MASHVVHEALRRAKAEVISLEDLLLEGVLADAPPGDRAREYARASVQLLGDAERELEAGI